MALQGKATESITEEDIVSLIENRVHENKILEYKETLPDNSHNSKREFLADVSSFANASGGDIIFGVSEENGEPVELCGFSIDNYDAERLRLENLIRDGIEPRLSGVSIFPVRLGPSSISIIVRIPRSWSLPHAVNHEGHFRFYSRNSGGKYPLDVSEIRAAVMISENAAERIGNFRVGRISDIVSGETSLMLMEGTKIVLHMVPIGAFDPAVSYDVRHLINNELDLAPVMVDKYNSSRFNFDGFMTFNTSTSTGIGLDYLQIFRNGIIESVDAIILRERDGDKYIPSKDFEEELFKSLHRFLKIQKWLGVEPPIFIMLTLLGVKDYYMGVNTINYHTGKRPIIDRENIVMPEFIVDNYEVDIISLLRPVLDVIWNAAGLPSSPYYNKDGEWIGNRF